MPLTSPNDAMHIMVIDDDTRLRSLLSQYLQEHGYMVSTAEDAAAAKENLLLFSADLLIIDVMMPGETGIVLAQYIRQTSTIPILMLTAMTETNDRIAGLESGADDYVSKPFEPKELLLRITRILERTKGHKATISFGDFLFYPKQQQLSCHGSPIHLTDSEKKLMTILAEHCNHPVSRKTLASLCGQVNERSIDVQMTRLRNKIEENPKKPRYIQTIRNEGYILYTQ